MNKKPVFVFGSIIGVQLISAAAVALFAFYRYPSNHWGVDVRWAYLIGGIGVALSAFLLSRRECRMIGIVGMLISLVFCMLIFSTDRFNILVQYERWIARGMPASPFSAERK